MMYNDGGYDSTIVMIIIIAIIIYRVGDVEVDASDRPVDTLTIHSIEVLWNPFNDIVVRDLSRLTSSSSGRLIQCYNFHRYNLSCNINTNCIAPLST